MEEVRSVDDTEKQDEAILPGFRFHPTDEELVGFYLKRKIQQKSLPIELIRQLDIYKYDPWDLPKLATSGEKEWYFYCPRDRKYRNSARPNRVTGAGFWKATGTDRPIYASDGSRCIGLKKSLVFYKGRAAKGIKTDWMMHEFRLPSLADASLPPQKKPLEKTIPPNDSWAICRIFKKTNSTAQRAFSHSWVSPFSTTTATTYASSISQSAHGGQFSPENASCTTDIAAAHFAGTNCLQQQQHSIDFSCHKPLNIIDSSSKPAAASAPPPEHALSGLLCSPPFEVPVGMDVASIILNASSAPFLLGEVAHLPANIEFGQPQQYSSRFTVDCTADTSAGLTGNGNSTGALRPVSFPFNLQGSLSEEWRASLSWDSIPCATEITANYSTTKCYT